MSPECNLIAFLAYWLSRFVMSNNRGDNVRLETLVMAAKLSQGITLSLAPAVLANIYRVFPPSPCPPILPIQTMPSFLVIFCMGG